MLDTRMIDTDFYLRGSLNIAETADETFEDTGKGVTYKFIHGDGLAVYQEMSAGTGGLQDAFIEEHPPYLLSLIDSEKRESLKLTGKISGSALTGVSSVSESDYILKPPRHRAVGTQDYDLGDIEALKALNNYVIARRKIPGKRSLKVGDAKVSFADPPITDLPAGIGGTHTIGANHHLHQSLSDSHDAIGAGAEMAYRVLSFRVKRDLAMRVLHGADGRAFLL